MKIMENTRQPKQVVGEIFNVKHQGTPRSKFMDFHLIIII